MFFSSSLDVESDVVINLCGQTWFWTRLLINGLAGGNNLSAIMSLKRGPVSGVSSTKLFGVG